MTEQEKWLQQQAAETNSKVPNDFKSWLNSTRAREEDNRFGDFAFDVYKDEYFPITDDFDEIYTYLEKKTCPDLEAINLNLFNTAWYFYKKDLRLHKPKEKEEIKK